jgi:hypothetical protein
MRRVPRLVVAVVFLLGAAPGPATARPETDAVLYRIFLNDGSTLVSYGEYVRMDDRVVFSLPFGADRPDPTLQLVTIPSGVVNWPSTDRYAASARYGRYVETRAEADFAAMSNEVATALNEVALTLDPKKRLTIAENARRTLAEWPLTNLGYRAHDIRQTVALLDEVISELRLANGDLAFDLSLVAIADPPALVPLQPAPTLQESITQALLAARLTPAPAERLSLLQTVAALIERDAESLPSVWAATTATAANAAILEELQIDRGYAELSRAVVTQAAAKASTADVRGVEQLLRDMDQRDARLGRKRPEVVASVRRTVENRLDAARRLRLARDQWLLRRAAYERYNRATRATIERLTQAVPLLEDIKALAGPDRETLVSLERRVAQSAREFAGVKAPPGLQAAHDLLARALELAESAVRSRARAVASGELAAAWEASSAAGSSVMLIQQVKVELDRSMQIPELQ